MGEGTLDWGSMLGSRRPERGELLAGEALQGRVKTEKDCVTIWIFFWRPIKFKSVLSLHVQLVFTFLACLVLDKKSMKILLPSLKTLLILKVVPKAASNFWSGFPLLSLVNFFLVYIHSRFSEQFSESQARFGTTFKATGGYQKAGTSFLKRVTAWKEFHN